MSKKGQQRIAAPPDFRRTVQAIVAKNAKGPKEPDASIKTQSPAPTQPEPQTPAASAQPAQPKPPAKPQATAAPPTELKPGVVPDAPATKAGVKEYDWFFSLYALFVSLLEEGGNACSIADGWSGRRDGWYFLPLGFIPGPAVLVYFEDVTPFIKDKTPDVGNLTEEVLAKIGMILKIWQEITEALDSELSPWYFGFAHGLLSGHLPKRYLAMGMTNFRLATGDPEKPFGVKLVPHGDNAMRVDRIYNPTNIPGAPAEGETLTLVTLKEGRGPVQKLLRTWKGFEDNYDDRFHKDGTPREDSRERLKRRCQSRFRDRGDRD